MFSGAQGAVVGAFLGSQAAALGPGGRFGDRLGPKRSLTRKHASTTVPMPKHLKVPALLFLYYKLLWLHLLFVCLAQVLSVALTFSNH